MQSIIRATKGKIRRERVPTEEEVEEKRANLFYDTLRQTLEDGKYERQDAMIGRLLDQGFVATDIASALIHLFTAEAGSAPPRQERPAPPANFRSDERGPANGARAKDHGSRHSHDRGIEERRDRSGGTGRKEDRTSGQVSHEPGMARLTLGVGREHDVQPGDVLGVIVGITKLPKETVGVIRLQSKQAFVDVAEDQADFILAKLNGITFKGRKLWCKRADLKAVPAEKPRT